MQENCIITKITSNRLEDTIRSDIIKKAALLDAESKKKKEKLVENNFNYLISMDKINISNIDKKWQSFWSEKKNKFKNTDKNKNFIV